jgi:hypothetical protein
VKHTPIEDAVVARTALAVAADGREFTVTAKIGRPYPAADGDWACPVDLTPLYPRLIDQHGVDSWQALQLCYRLVAQLLAGFEQDGGKIYWPTARELMDAADFLPRSPT